MNAELKTVIGEFLINYDAVKEVLALEASSALEKEDLLLEDLPYFWKSKYLKMSNRTPDLLEINYNEFRYYFDYYSYTEMDGVSPMSETIEDRVMAVMGKSRPRSLRPKRTSTWLKGLVGPTTKRWGPQYDKGHYIAYTLGGGEQLNIFPQRRDLNRGHSLEGKLFRDMENYCHRNPGTLCFHRPIYLDESVRPAALDFGLLTKEGNLWVETFDNRERPVDGKLFQNVIPKGKELNTWRKGLRQRVVP